jgi:hypothetical protein
MSLRWPLLAAGGAAIALSVLIGLTAANAAPGGDDRPAPRRAPAVPPVPVEVVSAARTATPVAVVASGPRLRVERVRLPKPASLAPGAAPATDVLRLTIQGRFDVRDAALLVLVDGAPAGRAIESPDLRSATAVLPAALVRDGAAIAYGYGETGTPTAVGTLTVVK